jgi:hypothetical protein
LADKTPKGENTFGSAKNYEMRMIFIFATALGFACCDKSSPSAGFANHREAGIANVDPTKDYTAFHRKAKAFCASHGFDQSYYFLADLSIHSGKNRFFVHDFATGETVAESLVTHGSCDQFADNPNKWETARFSNAGDSHCSAKGKYKIGRREWSTWGIHVKYWLHGLEKSNSNAVGRVIVLHSWSAVADTEIYPQYSPLSWGCPAVSDAFMRDLDARLQKTEKPVLLWIVG